MSFQCDRCGDSVELFGLSYLISLDYKQGQPDSPIEADDRKGHFCLSCRDEFRDFLAEGATA